MNSNLPICYVATRKMKKCAYGSLISVERPLSEWPLFFNPAFHSFLQKWRIYALYGSRCLVYKKQCSIRDAEALHVQWTCAEGRPKRSGDAACQWHACIPAGHVGTDRSGAERERPVDISPVQILSHRRCMFKGFGIPKPLFFSRNLAFL